MLIVAICVFTAARTIKICRKVLFLVFFQTFDWTQCREFPRAHGLRALVEISRMCHIVGKSHTIAFAAGTLAI
jgi:hypothetical protein